MAVAFVRDLNVWKDGEEFNSPAPQQVVMAVPAAGCAAGNTMVVWVTVRGAIGTTTITDSAGNTYTKRKEATISDLYVSLWTAYLTTELVDGDSVTVDNDNTSALVAGAAEFSGVSETDPIDSSASNTGSNTNATVTCPATSGADRMVVVANGHAHSSTLSASISSGWTALNALGWIYLSGAGPEYALFRAYKALASAGSATATWSYATKPNNWAACAVALQSGPGGGTPTKPDGLTATAASSSQINLAWSDNSNNESGFRIERSLDGSNWTEIATVGAGVTSYQNTGLTAGTTYRYRVRAYNGSGNSAFSNTATATTDAGSGATTPPTEPGPLAATGIGTTRILLEWIDQSDDEEGFKVERSTDGSTWVQAGTAGADVTSWISSGLQPSTLYYFRVRAYNSAGNSAYTNTASAVTFDEGEVGSGDCPVERYATVGDVQRLIWSGHLAISDGSEPNRAAVEDWLCDISQWLDAVLAWRYVVPVTDPRDREVLRPICAALTAARCWTALVGRNPGQEARAQELESEGLSRLVFNPAGMGSRLKGTASLVVANRAAVMGRAHLILPYTAETGRELGLARRVLHTFTKPESAE